jgi:NADH-quinone oxidoreductase subunit N
MFVFLSLADQGHWGALGCAAVAAAAGFYYYFRIILAMYTREGAEDTPAPALTLSPLTKGIAIALAAVVVVLGVYPKPLQKVLTPNAAAVVAK